MEKLIVSSSPHLRSGASTQRIMLDVIIALCPALIASFVFFGPRALILVAVTVLSCVLSEYISRKVMKRDNTVPDLSCIVTGLLLAFNLPVSLNPLMAVFGGVVAIVVVKQMFGGIGQNFVNPALTARIILMNSFPADMSSWTPAFGWLNGTDATTTATPVGCAQTGRRIQLLLHGFVPWQHRRLLGRNLRTGTDSGRRVSDCPPRHQPGDSHYLSCDGYRHFSDYWP